MRRDEYAEATREAVIAAARRLFAEKGYARTTVDEIAALARVSPATVYMQCGGKRGLLESLMDAWTTGDLIQRTEDECAVARTRAERMRRLADGYVRLYAAFGDIIRIVTGAAASSTQAAECLRTANDRHRAALALIVGQFEAAGDLREGVTPQEAVQIIFYFFRHEQFSLLADEFGWGVSRAREWIREAVEHAVLRA